MPWCILYECPGTCIWAIPQLRSLCYSSRGCRGAGVELLVYVASHLTECRVLWLVVTWHNVCKPID